MNRDDVIRMAKQADAFESDEGAWGTTYIFEPIDLERFAALVAAAEREEICKMMHDMEPFYAEQFIEAIRARGNT